MYRGTALAWQIHFIALLMERCTASSWFQQEKGEEKNKTKPTSSTWLQQNNEFCSKLARFCGILEQRQTPQPQKCWVYGAQREMAGAVHISLSLFQALCSLSEASDYTPFTFSRLSLLLRGLESSFCLEVSWGWEGRLSRPLLGSSCRGHCRSGGWQPDTAQLWTTPLTAHILLLPVWHPGRQCLLGKQVKIQVF